MLSVISPPGFPLVFRFQSLGFKRSLSKKGMPHYSFIPTSLPHPVSPFGEKQKIAANVCFKTVLKPKVELLILGFHSLC